MLNLSAFLPASSLTLVLFGLVLILSLLLFFSWEKTEYILYALLVWFPIETLVLRYTPASFYSLIKYFPEVLIYSTFFVSWFRFIDRKKRIFPATPINPHLIVFLLICGVSLLSNWYSPTTWFLGIRQVLRFVLIFFIVLFENYSHDILKNFLKIGLVVVMGEAALAVIQYLSGGFFDKYLFFTDSISVGSIQLEGIQESWAPGQRAFATLGRYDRLGSLLVIGLAMLFPWFYTLKTQLQKERWWIAFTLGVVALVLTYSRANWIAFVAAMITIGYFLMKDRRIFKLTAIFGGLLGAYLLLVLVTQSFGTGSVDQTGKQSIRDRIVEAVSPYSWQQSYEGYGRFFFIINTPLMVVARYPLFGVGPGNYGGGVAAALLNKNVYDQLHLPFGIQNTYGQIDNNWFSLWGETGTLGLIIWILLFSTIYQSAKHVRDHSEDLVQKTVAEGVCGATVAIVILGFFGPYFEFRTLMVYYWLAVGIAFHYFRERKFSWNFLRE